MSDDQGAVSEVVDAPASTPIELPNSRVILKNGCLYIVFKDESEAEQYGKRLNEFGFLPCCYGAFFNAYELKPVEEWS